MAAPTDDLPDGEPEKPDDSPEVNPEGFPFEKVGHQTDGEEKPEDPDPKAGPESEPEKPDDDPKPRRKGISLEELAKMGKGRKPKVRPKSRPEKSEGPIERMQREQAEAAFRQLDDPNVRAAIDSAAGLSGDMFPQNGLGGTDEAVRQFIRDGGMGLGPFLEEHPDLASGFGRTALLPDSLTDIVQGIGSAWRDGSSFWEDVQLTRQFLAGHDVTQAISSAEASTMSALLENLDSFADVTRRALDAYSITPETFGQMIDSLDSSQLDAITRQASSLLWEEIEQRGWTETSLPPRPRPNARADAPSKQPPREPEKVHAEAPSEQAAVLERIRRRPIWEFIGTGQATFLGMFVVAAIPFIFSNSSVQTSVHGETDGDVEIRGNTVLGDVTVVNNNISVVIIGETLDRIDTGPESQAEAMQDLRDFCEALPDGPVPATDTAGKSDEQPKSPDTSASQAPSDVRPDAGLNTSGARPDDTVDVQPDESTDTSSRTREASSADVQADTAENGEQPTERRPIVGNQLQPTRRKTPPVRSDARPRQGPSSD